MGKNGRSVWIQASYNPVFDVDGRVIKVVKFATDVTDRVHGVTRIADSLSRLAAGDLQAHIEAPIYPALEKIRVDFNESARRLSAAISMVAANANEIDRGTREIANASDDLAKRTEQQAANLEETTAALQEITRKVQSTAQSTKSAMSAVVAAQGDAEASSRVVGSAILAMGQIEESSKQISRIIGVIDEIAFQTNLLALNAGVEAARAGDAGRGFAVVASEVRALAQRSADAAKEIKELIERSTAQVSQGVSLVGETGQGLSRILTQVTSVSSIVTGISGMAQEQASGLEQINVAARQMDQITQQNAAMVEEATAAARMLAGQVEQLAASVGTFKLGPARGEQSGARGLMRGLAEAADVFRAQRTANGR